MAEAEELEQTKKDLRVEMEAEYTRRLTDEVTRLEDQQREHLENVVNDWKKSQAPPTIEDIRILLSQEYYEFPVKFASSKGEKIFVIKELPQAIEKRFYRMLKAQLIPKVKELANLTVRLAEGNVESKLTSIMEMFEPTFDVLAQTVQIILDPFEQDEDITVEWVQLNISSFRQWNIILAQERANRLRDFFSHVSQASLGGMMNGVSTQS